jgi:hypothetical protein
MAWGPTELSRYVDPHILLGHQGYAGVSTTQELAARMLHRGSSQDPQGEYHIETIRFDTTLWPSGFSEPASGVRPLTIEA